MTEAKKMTSIVRRINMSMWGKRFAGVLFFDLVLAVLYIVFFWRLKEYGWPTVEQLVEMWDCFYTYVRLPACILGGLELLYLFGCLFDTHDIRVCLKPLNDLAIKADQLAQINIEDLEKNHFSEAQLEHLGQAIDGISPDALEAGVHTGDRDLQSIEVALNNLLKRMRENQKQQTRFVSDASHELRTPIAVIQGYVNMLDRWGKEDEAVLTESIEALKNESEHMKTLVEQLLFLARGDSGRNTLNKVDFDLNEVMRDVCDESMMIDSAHPYVFVPAPDVRMNGDISMVKQSMRIFIQNAAKYSNSGDTITLKVFSQNGTVGYSVQDEGIGMRESDVAHIFERFYRSDEARNSETGGTGLGLSIAKWIVEAHNGRIEVLSRPDFGTRFTVKFNSSL